MSLLNQTACIIKWNASSTISSSRKLRAALAKIFPTMHNIRCDLFGLTTLPHQVTIPTMMKNMATAFLLKIMSSSWPASECLPSGWLRRRSEEDAHNMQQQLAHVPHGGKPEIVLWYQLLFN